ncbi:MAG: HAD-IA family hydrolase [Candidatus Parcubacteria bacterium]|nr:HAD-IA family hydrolase [Burkholderiales bacterium]
MAARSRCRRRCPATWPSSALPISSTLNPDKRYRLIVFDWDGTLMDSTAGITVCIQEAARDMGLPVPPREAASHVIGLGLHDSLRSAVPSLPAEKYAAFVELYRKHFHARQEAMVLFPGVPEMLAELRNAGHLLAVATGKSRRGLDHALQVTGLAGCFEASRCADETESKPHPAMLLELMRELRLEAKDLLMIGDTSHDLGMAKSAGVDAVAVTYGAHEPASLLAFEPRACVANVVELRQWLTTNA